MPARGPHLTHHPLGVERHHPTRRGALDEVCVHVACGERRQVEECSVGGGQVGCGERCRHRGDDLSASGERRIEPGVLERCGRRAQAHGQVCAGSVEFPQQGRAVVGREPRDDLRLRTQARQGEPRVVGAAAGLLACGAAVHDEIPRDMADDVEGHGCARTQTRRGGGACCRSVMAWAARGKWRLALIPLAPACVPPHSQRRRAVLRWIHGIAVQGIDVNRRTGCRHWRSVGNG